MNDPSDAPREYLRQALKDRGIEMKAASLMLEHGHSYIRDYLEKRTPIYLKERDRELLVKEYGLQDELLRPPPKVKATKSAPAGERPLAIDTKVNGDAPEQALNEQMLFIWQTLGVDVKIAALSVIKALVAAWPKAS